MPVLYRPAPPEVRELLDAVLRKWNRFHPLRSADFRFDLLMAKSDGAKPPLKHGAAAEISKVKPEEKADGAQLDARIKIDKAQWEEFEPEEREALLAHEVYHVALKDGLDDYGRPKFAIIEDDVYVTMFWELYAWYGRASMEALSFRTLRRRFDRIDEDKLNQLPFMHPAEREESDAAPSPAPVVAKLAEKLDVNRELADGCREVEEARAAGPGDEPEPAARCPDCGGLADRPYGARKPESRRACHFGPDGTARVMKVPPEEVRRKREHPPEIAPMAVPDDDQADDDEEMFAVSLGKGKRPVCLVAAGSLTEAVAIAHRHYTPDSSWKGIVRVATEEDRALGLRVIGAPAVVLPSDDLAARARKNLANYGPAAARTRPKKAARP